MPGLCSFRQGLASPARVHVLLQQRVCSRVLLMQSKQLVDCLLRNQLSPTDLVPEIAPRFSGPCRFFEQIFDTRYTPLLWRGVASSCLFSFAGPLYVPVGANAFCSPHRQATRFEGIEAMKAPGRPRVPVRKNESFRLLRLYFLHAPERNLGIAAVFIGGVDRAQPRRILRVIERH